MNRSLVIAFVAMFAFVSQVFAAGYYSGRLPDSEYGPNPVLEIDAYTAYIQQTQPAVSATAARHIASVAYWEARRAGIQPSLVLAIMQIESTFNPNARNGGCFGLLQVNYRVHRQRIWRAENAVGVKTMLNPRVNIHVGVSLLKKYLDESNGNVTRGLLRYNGAVHWNPYPIKVLAAQRRIRNYMIAYAYVDYQPSTATA